MERQRKRETRPRFGVELDENEHLNEELNRSLPSNTPKASRTTNIPANISINHPYSRQSGLRQTNTSHIGGTSLAGTAPLPPSTSSSYGNPLPQNNGYNPNTMGFPPPWHNCSLDTWSLGGQASHGNSVASTVQYNAPVGQQFQGFNAPASTFVLPGPSPQSQQPMIPVIPCRNVPVLPKDGEILKILIKNSGLSTIARLDLRNETSFIQPREVKVHDLEPLPIPGAKRRFYTLDQGAQSPKAFVQALVDVTEYVFRDLDLAVQISLDDDTDAPIRLGRGFFRRLLTSLGYDIGSLQQLLPFFQNHPNQVHPVMTPTSFCFTGFTGISPYRPFHVPTTNLVIPAYPLQNMANPASFELAPSYDSMSPSLQPSGQSWEVETLSSVTTPLDTSTPWDEFNPMNIHLPSTEQSCNNTQATPTPGIDLAPQPPGIADTDENYNHH